MLKKMIHPSLNTYSKCAFTWEKEELKGIEYHKNRGGKEWTSNRDKGRDEVREKEAGGRVDGCCQSAIGFSIWWISPQGSKRQLNRDPFPSSIPCPDNSRSVSTAPLTVTGWWPVTTGVIWGALLKCQIDAGKKLFYWTYLLERIWVMRGFAFWLYCTSRGASHTFKLQQSLWEYT